MSRRSVQLSHQEQEKYTRVFMDLDIDRNGWLSREEIGEWLHKAGYRLTEQQIESVFRIIDTNADGRITLDEFYTVMYMIKNPPSKSSDLQKVFQAMDKDGDGLLSEDELYEGLNRCGHNFSKQEVRKIMANLDRDDDGQISFQEFLTAFKN